MASGPGLESLLGENISVITNDGRNIVLENISKDLLHLETSSPLESTLLVCNRKVSPLQTEEESHRPRIAPIPKSQFLGKVRDFLGVISDANKKLELEAKDNAEGCNIEALTGNESELIEMDLMLGVADLNSPEAVAAAEAALTGRQQVMHVDTMSSGSESEDSSDDEEDNDNDITISSSKGHKRFKSGKDVSSSEAVGENESNKHSKIVELS